MADSHATGSRVAKRVLSADVIDRIERLRKGHRGASFARVEDGYEDALDDLLDAFHGFCYPDVWLKEAQ